MTWCVTRTDDLGNTIIMIQGLTQKEAQNIVKIFEERGHHQTYEAKEQK